MITTNGSEIWSLLYYTSPEYLRAYEDGYEACKQDMLKAVNGLKALSTIMSTVSSEEVKE